MWRRVFTRADHSTFRNTAVPFIFRPEQSEKKKKFPATEDFLYCMGLNTMALHFAKKKDTSQGGNAAFTFMQSTFKVILSFCDNNSTTFSETHTVWAKSDAHDHSEATSSNCDNSNKHSTSHKQIQLGAQFCSIYLFITLLYMFRVSMCPSSGENCCIYATLVLVTLYGWRLVCWLDFNPTSRPVANHTEWQIAVSPW